MKFEAIYQREGTPGWKIKSWDDANTLLGYVKPEGPSSACFTIANQNYVQCAGSKKRLTVEARIYVDEETFVHYCFGKGDLLGKEETIDCNVGEIVRDSSQVLSMRDARLIIRHFVENNGALLEKYVTHDITKMFQQGT